MSVRIKQETHYKGNDWWKWSVWLDGPKRELDRIDHVVYTLHPTFREPVRRITDRKTNFRLDSAGWGAFDIYLELIPKIFCLSCGSLSYSEPDGGIFIHLA